MTTETPTPPARPPIYAELGDTCEQCTFYTVYVFDRQFTEKQTGEGHRRAAALCVDHLNEYFGQEWFCVKKTHADIMQAFTEALGRLGVADATIQAAVDELVANAGS